MTEHEAALFRAFEKFTLIDHATLEADVSGTEVTTADDFFRIASRHPWRESVMLYWLVGADLPGFRNMGAVIGLHWEEPDGEYESFVELGFDAVETRWYLRCLHDDPATPRDLVDLARELRVPEDVRRPLVEPEAKAAMRRIIACFLAASFA